MCESFIARCCVSVLNNGFVLLDMLKVLMDGTGEQASAEGMVLLRKEVDKMKEALKAAEEGLCPFVLTSRLFNEDKFCNGSVETRGYREK